MRAVRYRSPAPSLVLVLTLLFLTMGCATVQDARMAKGSGLWKVYPLPYETVWRAVAGSMEGLGLVVVLQSSADGVVLAEHGMSAFSWGERIAVFVEDVGGRIRTRVEVVSKRALATNITAKDWEAPILEAIDSQLREQSARNGWAANP
jgi:hypothetical protein